MACPERHAFLVLQGVKLTYNILLPAYLLDLLCTEHMVSACYKQVWIRGKVHPMVTDLSTLTGLSNLNKM